MRVSQTFRWWILLPLLLIFILPLWMQLGVLLGYDLFPAQDALPPRQSSQLLGFCFYIVWWGLVIFAFLPSGIVMLPFGDFIPDPMRVWFGLILVSLIYSGILFLIRLVWLSLKPAGGNLVPGTPNDA
jgi:hypothetical protein